MMRLLLLPDYAIARPLSCSPRSQYCTAMLCTTTGSLGFRSKVVLSSDQQLQYGPSFRQLDVLVQPQTADRLYVKIAPEGQQRWTVPESIVPR